MLSTNEIAKLLNIHPVNLDSWRKHGLVKRHANTGYKYLYEVPDPILPAKKSSMWDPEADK